MMTCGNHMFQPRDTIHFLIYVFLYESPKNCILHLHETRKNEQKTKRALCFLLIESVKHNISSFS